MNRKSVLLAATAALLLAGPAHAEDGIKITPGKWRITMTSQMPMMPQPRTKTSEECIARDTLSPEMLMENAEQCELTDIQIDGNKVTWQMSCNNPQGEGDFGAQGMLDVNGDTLQGRMDIAMTVNGQSMNASMDWAGQRIGDCS